MKKPTGYELATVALSIAAIVVAVLSHREAYQARMDTRRAALRSETLTVLQSSKAAIDSYDCHLAIAGVKVDHSTTNYKQIVTSSEELHRLLGVLNEYDISELTIYENNLNELKAALPGVVIAATAKVRLGFSGEQLARADAACAFGG